MLCEKCRQPMTIERVLTPKGHEVEVEYCGKCMLLSEFTLAGFEYYG